MARKKLHSDIKFQRIASSSPVKVICAENSGLSGENLIGRFIFMACDDKLSRSGLVYVPDQMKIGNLKGVQVSELTVDGLIWPRMTRLDPS